MEPEESMRIQSNLASTIAMAFDECPNALADRDYIWNSVERTTRWLGRRKAEMARLNSLPDTINREQLLFGINQGAIYEDIRISMHRRFPSWIGRLCRGRICQWARVTRKCTGSLMRWFPIFRRISRLTSWVWERRPTF